MEIENYLSKEGGGLMILSRTKIDTALAKKEMTVQQLAESYGASKNRIYVIMNSRNVSHVTAGKIARALGVDVTEILADE